MAEKRCYNKNEAVQYFGINLSAFEIYIEPELEGKGITIGDCLVYEASDLDTAWDTFKKKTKGHAHTPTNPPQTQAPVAVKKPRGRSKEAMPSSASGSAAWNAAVKRVLEKGKPKKK